MKHIFPVFALVFLQVTLCSESSGQPLRVKGLAKSDKLINQLQRLDTQIDFLPNRPSFEKLLRSIAKTARSLPESDIKTDISTAIYWYQQSAVNERATTPCAGERPGAYQRLCETTAGQRVDLSRAKARLHTLWATSLLKAYKTGNRDPLTLEEIAFERRNDQLLARRIIEVLKLLEADVISYDSLGDFEEGRKLARVSFEVFMRDLDRVSAEAEIMLSWLPQNRLHSELRNALRSYQDGGFWWEKTHSPRVVNASTLRAFDSSRTSSDTADLTSVPYTIVINWRHGSRYLKHAEELLKRQSATAPKESFSDLAGGIVVREN